MASPIRPDDLVTGNFEAVQRSSPAVPSPTSIQGGSFSAQRRGESPGRVKHLVPHMTQVQEALSMQEVPGSRMETSVLTSPLHRENRNFPQSKCKPLPYMRFPTCDYDPCENVPQKQYLDRLGHGAALKIFKWLLTLVIAALTALTAYFIDISVEWISKKKFHYVLDSMSDHSSLLHPFFLFLGLNVALAAVAAFLVSLAPVAGGSGIPEIKCYLNGLRLPDVLSLKTFVAKALGVLFSVSAGLPCGKEGPMIHSGAIVADGVSQGRTGIKWLQCRSLDWFHNLFIPFRDDKHRRDFVSCGAAAGVAAAFGAPVGGVLFALEEGCSYLDQTLTWRIFFCSVLCAFSMAIFTGTSTGERSLNAPGMIDFGDFTARKAINFGSVEVVWFLLIGAWGGLSGALFNHINLKITALRRRRDKYLLRIFRREWAIRAFKFFEALLMASAVTGAAFFCLGALPQYCMKKSQQDEGFVPEFSLRMVHCDDKDDFNVYASMWLSSASDTLRLLFHFPEHLPNPALLIFGILYFILMVCNYGVAVPSGLFVPSLLTGAVFGRLFAQLVQKIPYHTFEEIDPGTYALIGAASFLAGVCRISFSLTVILIEATRDIAYALPLMLSIMAAKIAGDLFNKGIYDEHIEFRNLAFLEPNIPHYDSRGTYVRDVMTGKLVTLNPVESVNRILQALRDHHFCGFPVCRDDHKVFGTEYDGLITRNKLLVLLWKKRFESRRKVIVDTASMADVLPERKAACPDFGVVEELLGMTGGRIRGEVTESGSEGFVTVAIEGLKSPVKLPVGAVYDAPDRNTNVIPWEDFQYPYVDYRTLKGAKGLKRIEENLELWEYNYWVDLRPYMNPQPFLVPDNFSLERCYRLFRSVGMRHMLVMDASHRIVGILTRYDLWNYVRHLEHPPPGWVVDGGRLVLKEEGSDHEESSTDGITDDDESVDGKRKPLFNTNF